MAAKSGPIHNIVIIGGSFAGISAAHVLLRHILPPLSAASSITYKVTLVSPSAFFFWKIASPRSVVKPDQLSPEQQFVPITDGFKEYDSSRFEFVQANVTQLDHGSKKLAVEDTASKENRHYDIFYDSVLICTGTTQTSPLFSQHGTDLATRKAFADIHEKIPKAKTIVVAGGGAVGTELAGELGDVYGHSKDVTILSGSTRLLPRLAPSKSSAAENALKQLGVKVVHNLLVTSATDINGKTNLKFSDGTERAVDVYIPSVGDKPNSGFLPKEWLNERGFVKTKVETLRLDVPGVSGVYVLGSVGSYATGGVLDIYNGVRPCCESVRVDLFSALPPQVQDEMEANNKASLFCSLVKSTPSLKEQRLLHKPWSGTFQFVPIGRNHGVGVIADWGLPSWAVVMAKGKTFLIENAPLLVIGKDYRKA